MFQPLLLLSTILPSALAGSILWDGRFNTLPNSSALNAWSWSNEVGPYQYYIHGPSAITSYINLSPSYKNPADTGSTQGAKFTLDSTSYWNGQTMRRTELIPQTSAAINTGLVYYHFSMMRSDVDPPSIYREHQICFFESHFTEMKAGWISGEAGTSDNLLRWDVGGVTKWSVAWAAGEWHNIAYAIDFTAGTVAFYHSTGSDPLALTVPAVTASTSSNGADWHLGVLELPVSGQADTTEDYYFSGVYVESGGLTTGVSGPGGTPVVSSSAVAKTTSTAPPLKSTSTAKVSTVTTLKTVATTSSKVATSSAPTASATGVLAAKYAQCGGTGYSGPTVCVAGCTCTKSSEYYSQCL